MTWVRIDDHFDEHPKLAKVGPIGWGVWLAGLAYCNRNLTDGFIPFAVAEGIGGRWRIRVLDEQDDTREIVWTVSRTSGHSGRDMETEWVIDLLIHAGLWEVGEGGYWVHDYDDYQPSKAEVVDQRTKTAARVQKHRSNAVGNAGRNGVTNAAGNSVSNTAPDPDPSGNIHSLARDPPGPPSVAAPGRPDYHRLEGAWCRATRTTQVPSDFASEVADRCHRAALAQSPPAEPNAHAEKCIAAFVRYAEGCPPPRQPQLSPSKFTQHFARIERLVAGIEKFPDETPPEADGNGRSRPRSTPPRDTDEARPRPPPAEDVLASKGISVANIAAAKRVT